MALDAALNVVAALAVADEDDTGTQGFILRSKSEESGLGRNIQFTFRKKGQKNSTVFRIQGESTNLPGKCDRSNSYHLGRLEISHSAIMPLRLMVDHQYQSQVPGRNQASYCT